MAFGFPAYHTESFSPVDSQADLHAAVKKALGSLSWSVREETTEQILASSSMNLRSWGEKVLIRFLPDHSISVTSQCALPTQCFDWGKNKANVRRFLSELVTAMRASRRLPSAADFPPGTEFVIKEFDVPLVRVPNEGWFNWFGGVPRPYDVKNLKVDNNWPADSFEQWLELVEDSLKKPE